MYEQCFLLFNFIRFCWDWTDSLINPRRVSASRLNLAHLWGVRFYCRTSLGAICLLPSIACRSTAPLSVGVCRDLQLGVFYPTDGLLSRAEISLSNKSRQSSNTGSLFLFHGNSGNSSRFRYFSAFGISPFSVFLPFGNLVFLRSLFRVQAVSHACLPKACLPFLTYSSYLLCFRYMGGLMGSQESSTPMSSPNTNGSNMVHWFGGSTCNSSAFHVLGSKATDLKLGDF